MIQNMRDLGGTPARDGRLIRPGMLVRSAQLSQAEEGDLRGIASVMDLRTPGEQKEMPDRVHGREYLPLPLFDDVTAGISHESGAEDQGIPDMAFLYGRLMRECTDTIRSALLAVMRHDFSAGAILWHCSEGKDRCGMITALVLEALGVDRAIILEDYLKTNLVNLPKAEKIREKLLVTHGQAFADRVFRSFVADESYLQSAWDAMGEDYLHDALRLEDAELEAFRKNILTGEKN